MHRGGVGSQPFLPALPQGGGRRGAVGGVRLHAVHHDLARAEGLAQPDRRRDLLRLRATRGTVEGTGLVGDHHVHSAVLDGVELTAQAADALAGAVGHLGVDDKGAAVVGRAGAVDTDRGCRRPAGSGVSPTGRGKRCLPRR